MCRLDGPDLQDIRLQNLHQYHFKPQESAGHAFLFLWNRPKKSAQMCKLSQCLVFETERLVLQISVNISRPFDVSCKPEVTHCQAPTPPGLPPSNNQNFSFQNNALQSTSLPPFFHHEKEDLTEQQQLELPPGIPLVFPQLALDLGVDPLLLLLLLREAARHHCGCHPQQGRLITGLS